MFYFIHFRSTLKYFILILLLFSGCSAKDSIQGKEENNEFRTIFEAPALISAAMSAYRTSEGTWPTSTRDIELLFDGEGKNLFGVNWSELSDLIILDELPDGRLKVTSVDPEFPFTLLVGLPEGSEVQILENSKTTNDSRSTEKVP